jgi:methionyl-tRNA formyltransferase
VAEEGTTKGRGMNIVFFGSGAFAAPLAQHIHEQFGLKAVIVTKTKPHGRGRKETPSAIAVWAQEHGITVYAPHDPNTPEFVSTLTKFKPDVYVLASYGHILGGDLLRVPQYGGINVHPSLLPRHRGAAPIQRAIMEGATVTGLTVIMMDERIDHGDIIFQQSVVIEAHDTYGTLLERLSRLSTDSIGQILHDLERGVCARMPQDHEQKSYAPKIKKEETLIQWDRGVDTIRNLIRALSPSPAARTMFRGKELKIIAAHKGTRVGGPGVVIFESKDVAVGTGDGSLILDVVQPANRALMAGLDFKNGHRVQEGEVMA